MTKTNLSRRPLLRSSLAALLLLAFSIGCAPHTGAAQERAPTGKTDDSRAQGTVSLSSPDYSLLARLIHDETNRARGREGRQPLGRLQRLEAASREYSRRMVENSFFSHIDQTGRAPATPGDRVRAQGLRPAFVAENIAEVFARDYMSGERVYVREEQGETVFSRESGGSPLRLRTYAEVAEQVVAAWMESPGHRANILSAHSTHHGAGCQLESASASPMPMFVCAQLFYAPLPD